MSAEDAFKVKAWRVEEVNIAGMILKKGDIIEIGLGRNKIDAELLGFDRILYCFYVKDKATGDEMIIPYKSTRYVRKKKVEQPA
jgi:hypothetical protein